MRVHFTKTVLFHEKAGNLLKTTFLHQSQAVLFKGLKTTSTLQLQLKQENIPVGCVPPTCANSTCFNSHKVRALVGERRQGRS